MKTNSINQCPQCGQPLVIKVGRFGRFIACSGYPQCRYTRPWLVKVGVACPQCGGEIQLQETTGFLGCPFCGASLVLDLTGVRLHMLYRPRHGPADIPPLLRLWCDAQGVPAPSDISTPHLVYQPFWRFASQGRPRLFPAWPALEARWTDLPTPDAEQVIFDP